MHLLIENHCIKIRHVKMHCAWFDHVDLLLLLLLLLYIFFLVFFLLLLFFFLNIYLVNYNFKFRHLTSFIPVYSLQARSRVKNALKKSCTLLMKRISLLCQMR